MAKAKAIVEEQNAKIAELEGGASGGEAIGADTNRKKREREDDETEAAEPEAKRAKEVVGAES